MANVRKTMKSERRLVMPSWRFIAASIAVGGLSISSLTAGAAQRVETATSAQNAPATTPLDDANTAEDVGEVIPEERRSELLGEDWQQTSDLAWSVNGDSEALHILVASMQDGYRWSEIAALKVEGMETDRWIGNACLTSDSHYLGVVYAPRTFSNDEVMMNRGAFAAIVDVRTGAVSDLGGGYSLAYFNPGCGYLDQIVLSQFSDDGHTRLTAVSGKDGITQQVEVDQRVLSAIPSRDGIVGSDGSAVVRVNRDADITTLADSTGVPFGIATTASGALAYLEHDGETATAMYLESPANSPDPAALASGDLQEIGLTPDASGTVHITGEVTEVSDLPADVELNAEVEPNSWFSSDGEAAISSAYIPSAPLGAANLSAETAPKVEILAEIVESGAEIAFSVPPSSGETEVTTTLPEGQDSAGAAGPRVGFGMSVGRSLASTENPNSPISEGSPCAVPRNDPALQAMQPRPAEVEWAVNQAIRQTLHPDFPLPPLNGGGRVPAQIMLGILAQESNFWQAARYAVPGVTGNTLIGNYFGIDINSGAANAWWQINYAHADCGYGIAQVTTGMRAGDMPYALQKEIATDYKANLARGLQILIEKWNQTRSAGLVINNGDPAFLENWYYALWAYNTGFYTQSSGAAPWGVGWLNNPINPIYPPGRHPFLNDSPQDAATPNLWPYPERVLGFAAHSTEFTDSVSQATLGDTHNVVVAFHPAWWSGTDGFAGEKHRDNVQPPIDLFCNSTNECDPADLSTPCERSDSKCWFHEPATWKDCGNPKDECGHEYLSYSLGAPKPAAANSFPPNCSASGLPDGALIIDNLPNGTPSKRPGCNAVASAGTFQFTFAAGSANLYPGKVDVHQLGSGFNGQFWFTHVRVPDTDAAFGGALDVSGTWTLSQPLPKPWAKVYVHMPNHGAWTQQASYTISTGIGQPVTRTVNQRNYANEWVSLGALQFSGTPSVTLANNTGKFTSDKLAKALSGADDIAWDAVAFVPLNQKPTDFIVSLGDSYSSGEGTSVGNGSEFFRGSDHHGARISDGQGGLKEDPNRNACHRSFDAWPFGIDVPGTPELDSVRGLTQAKDSRLDFQLLACSGAVTSNVKSNGSGQYGELPQLDRGFLDANTTLVTMTIGGNDVGFGPVILACIMSAQNIVPDFCKNRTAPADLGGTGTIENAVNARLNKLQTDLPPILQQVRNKAPNAKIMLLGYPTLFDLGSQCVFILDGDRAWLNGVAAKLNKVLTAAASAAGVDVRYQSPQYRFQGSTLCQSSSGLTGIVFDLTKGDLPIHEFPVPGPNYGVPISQQSVHPTDIGSELYSAVANATIRQTKVPLASSLVGGEATTYYSTFRIHKGGPASMNVTQFSSCGNEIRFGLRKNDGTGVFGQQHTESLLWVTPQEMQSFKGNAGSGFNYDLPAGSYAVNGRLVAVCTGNQPQPWTADLYW